MFLFFLKKKKKNRNRNKTFYKTNRFWLLSKYHMLSSTQYCKRCSQRTVYLIITYLSKNIRQNHNKSICKKFIDGLHEKEFKRHWPYPGWDFLTLDKLGRGLKRFLPSINPEPVKPYLWNFAWVWYYITSFKKYQNSNQGHVPFLMASSYFMAVTKVKYFCE